MKKTKIFILFIIFFVFTNKIIFADSLNVFSFTQKTAFTNQAKQFNKSLWEPYSYGINKRIELQSFLLGNFIMPNIGIKINLLKKNKFYLSSQHSINYFTPWLKFWQGNGTGAIISPEINIPKLYLLENGIFASYLINNKLLISSNLNMTLALGTKINRLYSIDMPIIYNRFAPAFENAVFSLKTNLQGKITKRFNYMATFDYYYINSNQFSNFIETSIIGVFAKSTRFKFCLGPKLVYGQYPFGNQINILPYFNIIFNGSIKSKKTR